MAATATVEISESTPVDLFASLTNGTTYLAQLTRDSPHITVYQTESSAAPDPRSTENTKAVGTIYAGAGGGAELKSSSGDYLWSWTRIGDGNALLAITEI